MTQARPTPLRFGPWLLDERLGVGGMSEVWRARHRARDGEFAVKRLLPMFRQDAVLRGQFLHEIACLQRVHGPFLPQLLGHGDVGALPWLAMPLYTGTTLRALLASGPLPERAALGLVAELAAALATVHAAGLVHCDVSPGNVQVTADGAVVLLDFGIAQEAGAPAVAATRSVPGKPAYLSPEQIARRPLDGRSDLFAVGSLLVELLTGGPPFLRANREVTLRAVQACEVPRLEGISVPARRLIQDLLVVAAEERCQTAKTLRRRASALAGEPAHVRAELAARVAAVPPPTAAKDWQAAELRGETVTDPALDAGATTIQT